MSKKELTDWIAQLSPETRASSAFICGRLIIAAQAHTGCECALAVRDIVKEWKKAEAELAANNTSSSGIWRIVNPADCPALLHSTWCRMNEKESK